MEVGAAMTECGKCGKPRWWTIYMDGAEAVKAGYAFQNGYCYRRIRENRRKCSDYGDYVGQLEVVRDDAEAQLVGVFYMKSQEMDCREEFAGTL